MQKDYLSSFNQSDHCFLALSLPSSLRKLYKIKRLSTEKKSNSFANVGEGQKRGQIHAHAWKSEDTQGDNGTENSCTCAYTVAR